jgi:hypothetical protein
MERMESATRRLHLSLPLAALLIVAVVGLLFYAPILPTYFLADDYNYVGHLLSNGRAYVHGEQLGRWFIDFSAQGMQDPSLSVFFRPVVQWLWLTDYVAWGTWASGYHLTNIILHVLNSFWVYLLSRQVLRHTWGALLAGLLFALHPIHADSVSWIADRTDVLSTFFYLGSVAFFVMFRRRSRPLHYAISVIAFALAIGTKENTVALPAILLLYDLLYSVRDRGWKVLAALIPYGAVLLAYVGLRLFFFHEFGRNTGGGFLSFGAGLFFQFYSLALAQPFIRDMNDWLLLVALGLVALGLVLHWRRPGVWLGAGWVALSLLPSAGAAYVAPRLAYAPSAGLALALAAIFVRSGSSSGVDSTDALSASAPEENGWRRRLSLLKVGSTKRTEVSLGDLRVLHGHFRATSGVPSAWPTLRVGLALLLLTAYAWGLAARVGDWEAAGTVAGVISTETRRLYPQLPSDARLYYVGVPDILRGIYIYNDNFGTALQIEYHDPGVRAWRVDQFPILTDHLERVHFFEYRRRTIAERRDVVQLLERRRDCLEQSRPAVTWDFSQNAQDWEAWADLEMIQSHDRALAMRATGADPNLGGPTFDLPAVNLANVEVRMQVRAAARQVQGAIFWLTAGQADFSPLQQQPFTVQADGESHTYRIDLVQDGRFNLNDHVVRLRLDPVDAPGDIWLERIQLNAINMQGDSDACP